MANLEYIEVGEGGYILDHDAKRAIPADLETLALCEKSPGLVDCLFASVEYTYKELASYGSN